MIYILRLGPFGDVKIGTAKDPMARMKQLQTSLPEKLRLLRVMEGGRAEEAVLHTRFAAVRKTGEWFFYLEEMTNGDLGLQDLPLPKALTRYAPGSDESAAGQYRTMCQDLLEVCGGEEALAKAVGVAPWKTRHWGNLNPYLSAMVAIARQRGISISLEQMERMRAEAAHEGLVKAYQESLRPTNEDIRSEKYWLKGKHPSSAWWQRLTSDDEVTDPVPAPSPSAAA